MCETKSNLLKMRFIYYFRWKPGSTRVRFTQEKRRLRLNFRIILLIISVIKVIGQKDRMRVNNSIPLPSFPLPRYPNYPQKCPYVCHKNMVCY